MYHSIPILDQEVLTRQHRQAGFHLTEDEHTVQLWRNGVVVAVFWAEAVKADDIKASADDILRGRRR